MSMQRTVFALLILVFLSVWPAIAQTTQFTYQGNLKSNNNAANGPYDFEFALFDQAGNQVGITLSLPNITVTDGIFTVPLDFGNQFSGAARFLEVRVRPANQGSFVPLTPRQLINSAPHSVRALNAANALQLNGVAANQFVTTDDVRLVDPRAPSPGSFFYIQNGSLRQPLSNFNVDSGTATFFNSTSHYSLGGILLIHGGELGNIYFGFDTALAPNGAEFSSFFGEGSGRGITSGDSNSFFGYASGRATTLGSFNSFFGESAGRLNTIGENNTFSGYQSGMNNLDGVGNSFFGAKTGLTNAGGSNNTLIGYNTDLAGSSLSFATAIGAGASVSTNNSVVLGRTADTVRVPGALNVTGAGSFAGPLTVAGTGTFSGNLNVTGTLTAGTLSVPATSITGILGVGNGGTGIGSVGAAGNFLRSTGTAWVSAPLVAGDIPGGSANYIQNTTSAQASSNFNISGNGTVGGTLTGNIVSAGTQFNIGANRILTGSSLNLFTGFGAGAATTGTGNTFVGASAGNQNLGGTGNSFFGLNAGAANTTGTDNTVVGSGANVGSGGLTNATAIGAGSLVSNSNSVVLGRSADTVRVPGALNVTGNTTIGGSLSVTGAFSVPATSITGTLSASNGGTGLSSPGTTGNFLKSSGTGWTSTALTPADIPSLAGSYIQNGTTAQSGSFNITGNGTVGGNLTVGGTFSASVPSSSITGVLGIANGGTGLNTPGANGTFLKSNGTSWTNSVLSASDIPAGSSNYVQNTIVQQAATNFNIGGSGTIGGNLTVSGALNASLPASSITGTLGASNGGTGLSSPGTTGNFLRSSGTGWTSSAFTAADVPAGSANYIQNGITSQSGANFNISGNGTIGGSLTVAGTLNASVPTSSITGVLNTANGGTGLGTPGTSGNFLKSTGTGWTSTALSASDIPSLAGSYIQNGSTPQAGANFNIGGSGTIGGSLTVAGSISGSFSVPASNITGVLGATNGGTGLSSPGTNGNILRSNGTAWVSTPLVLNVADIPAGSSNYVQNTTSAQASTNFNVSGNGTAGGTLSGNVVNATTQFNINGSRILADSGNSVFVGVGAGSATTGQRNTIVGSSAGGNTSTGEDNVFVGRNAGLLNTTGNSNTVVGGSANVGSNNLQFASAIGANAVVNANDTIVIGKVANTYNGNPRPADAVVIPGTLNVTGTITVVGMGTSGGMDHVCLDASNRISQCSSSARYKYNVGSFDSGLNLVRRLRPVTFNWKSNGAADMGLVAEDVATVEPLLVNRNANGEVEGVKYDRVGVVLLNAVKEQQAQIESLQKEVETRKASEASLKERIDKQQAEIDAMKKFLCSQNPGAAICR